MFTSLFQVPVGIWISLFGLAIAIPILIHLINLWRYRRVKWAAMEFLLKGRKKKQKRVLLRQVLLITSRVLLLLLAIILFAQVRWNNQDSGQLRKGTVHFVLVDDSASMGQLQGASFLNDSKTETKRSDCWTQAKESVLKLAQRISKYPDQKLILTRLSEGNNANFEIVDCDSNIQSYVLDRLSSTPSDHSTSLLRWLENNSDRLPEFDQAYLLSDYRSSDFNEEKTSHFRELRKQLSDLTIVPCSDPSQVLNNLSLEYFNAEHNLPAVGVPFYVRLGIRNNSDEVRRNVKIQIRKSVSIEKGNFEYADESGVLIPEILPGTVETVQLPILVHEDGYVLLEAELPSDDLASDNVLQTAVKANNANRVLLVTDEPNSTSRYLDWVFEPATQANRSAISGFESILRSPHEIIQDKTQLDAFAFVFLLTDDLSHPKLIGKLEEYVRKGGRLIFVPGQYADLDRINTQLYRGGQGLLGFPIEAEIELPEKPPGVVSDITIVDPSLKDYFQGDSAKLLEMAQFYRKYVPPRNWHELNGVQSNVLVSIRGRATTPLVTRSSFGAGQVFVMLSPLTDSWNNWAKNPTFLVFIYQLFYQSRNKGDSPGLLVGEPITNILPGDTAVAQDVLKNQSRYLSDFKRAELPSLEKNISEVGLSLKRRGIYHVPWPEYNAWLTVQIDPNESKLSTVSRNELARMLSSPRISIVDWHELDEAGNSNSNSEQLFCWVTLFLILLAEQWLAWSMSFPERRSSPTALTSGGNANRREND